MNKHSLSILVLLLLMLSISPAIPQSAGTERESLNQIVMSLYTQGEYGQAMDVTIKALAAAESKHGKSHPDVAVILDILAWLYTYGDDANYEEAQCLYRRSLEIREKTLGSHHQDVAKNLGKLGLTYHLQKKYEQAELLYKRSLAILEKNLGPEHRDIASPLISLALLYRTQKNLSAAEPLFKRSLIIAEKTCGQNNPKIISNLDNLGNLYETEGKYTAAVPLFERALALDEKDESSSDFNVANRLSKLIALYRKMGKSNEADLLNTRAVTHALMSSAKDGNLTAVEAAIAAGADVDIREFRKSSKGSTPLHVAAEKGHLEVVKTLIQHGAVVDARDKEMNTPLMLAVRNNGTLDVVKYLVEHGADIRAKNKSGMMPLEHASYENDDYIHSVNRKLLGKNRYEVFGKVVTFKKVQLGNEGKSLWGGKTAEPCTLAINGKATEIPQGTWLNPGGFAYIIFPRDMSLTVGANDILFAKKERIEVSFDEKSGNITTQIGVPAKDMTLTVGGFKIPFFAKRYDPEYVRYRGQASMHFYDNGGIKEGLCERDGFHAQNGRTVKSPSKATKSWSSMRQAVSKRSYGASNAVLKVGNRRIAFQGGRGSSVATFPDGNIRSGDLAQDVSLKVGKRIISFRKGSTLSFHENGSVRSGTIRDEMPVTVDGRTKTLERQRLYFQEDGSLKMIYEGYKYKK